MTDGKRVFPAIRLDKGEEEETVMVGLLMSFLRLARMHQRGQQAGDTVGDLFSRSSFGRIDPISCGTVQTPTHRVRQGLLRHLPVCRVLVEAFYDHATDDGDDGQFHVGVQTWAVLMTGTEHTEHEVGDAQKDFSKGRVTCAVERDRPLFQKISEAGGRGGFKERVFVRVMRVKRGSVDGGRVGNISHGDFRERLLREELHERIVQELPGSAHPRVEALTEITHSAILRLNNFHCLGNRCCEPVYTRKHE